MEKVSYFRELDVLCMENTVTNGCVCVCWYCLMFVFRESLRSLGWHCSAAPTLIGC